MTSTKAFSGVWAFMSNGFVEPDGTTVEHEYQAAKTLDPAWKQAILGAAKPFGKDGAKSLGRKAPIRDDWESIKFAVMATLVAQKFADSFDLSRLLTDTGDTPLVEENGWHDQTWGNCFCGTRPECAGPGQNALGITLMAVRATHIVLYGIPKRRSF